MKVKYLQHLEIYSNKLGQPGVSQAGSPWLSHSAALLPGYAADGGEGCGSCLMGANNGMRWHLEYTDPVNLCAALHGAGGWRCPAGTSRAVQLLAELIA